MGRKARRRRGERRKVRESYGLLVTAETGADRYRSPGQRSPKGEKMFNVNQIVKGVRCGVFVIVGFRTIDGVAHAQVKPVHPVTHEAGRGEFALPLTAIVAAA